MSTAPTTHSLPPSPARAPWTQWLLDHRGAVLLAAALAGGLLAIYSFKLGMLMLLGLTGAMALALAYKFPVLPVAGVLLAVPFNYGYVLGGANIKISEAVTIGMLLVIMMRLIAGDSELRRRIRRIGPLVGVLGMLAFFALFTAAQRPNFFNTRYEIENYIALLYGVLFFRRSWWPVLIALFLSVLAVESFAALWLRFVKGVNGTSFFSRDTAVEMVYLTQTDLEALAGGQFRLAGTLGHKNILAAFYVLLLPVIGLEMLRGAKLWWLAAVIPSFVVFGLTDSMTGWAALMMILVFVLLHLRRFDYLAILTMMVLPVAIFVLIRFGDSIFFRIEQLFGSAEGWGTVSSRVEMLSISGRLIAEHPWLGIGRNNYMLLGETHYAHAHNLYLMKIIEMGIFAGVVFTLTLAALMGRTWQMFVTHAARLGRQHQYYRALGLWLGCLGFCAMNCFDYSYAHFGMGPIFMLFLGILLSISLQWDGDEAS